MGTYKIDTYKIDIITIDIIKNYIENTPMDADRCIIIITKDKYDDLLKAKLLLLDIHFIEYIFVLIFYNNNYHEYYENYNNNLYNGRDFYYKLTFSIDFLILKLNTLNNIENEKNLLKVFTSILERYENVMDLANNDK